MALPRLSDQQDVRRVIHHELGHWLMAREVGFDIGAISVDTYRGKAGGAAKVFPRAQTQLKNAAAVDEYLTKRIMVLCAGVRTEIEWYHRDPTIPFSREYIDDVYENGVIDTSGLTDKGKIDELLVILAGIRFTAATDNRALSIQHRALFEEIYHESCRISECFMDKLFALAKLVVEERWISTSKLVVRSNRLIELEMIASQPTSISQ
ncbi:hypothetical protein V2J97_01125 [Pseudomonas alliivorans]|nr:hypothetical protein [Pseudomonas alliivorans]